MSLRERRVVKDGGLSYFEYVEWLDGLFYSTESWDRFRLIKPGFVPEQRDLLKLCTEMVLDNEMRGKTERMPLFGIGEE